MNISAKTIASVAFLLPIIASPMKTASAATADTTFAWNQIPPNQDVPITRAVFDRGGYQLQDNAGETITAPYAANNLCALKFARSTTGGMYLVNEGCAPVLYMPADSDLQNGTVPGARWYPFRHGYNPSHPVYMSVAPSQESYDSMGWYPNMACYGGYEYDNDNNSGGGFGIDIGLSFDIGGQQCNSWQNYNSYCGNHRAYYHTAYYNQQVYGWSNRPNAGRRFQGSGHIWAHRNIAAGGRQHPILVAVPEHRVFRGTGVRNGGHDSEPTFNGAGNTRHDTTGDTTGRHVFRGAGNTRHDTTGPRVFRGRARIER